MKKNLGPPWIRGIIVSDRCGFCARPDDFHGINATGYPFNVC